MRILIVEDEAGISAFLRQGLEEESYAVDVAEEGKEGLNLALSAVLKRTMNFLPMFWECVL